MLEETRLLTVPLTTQAAKTITLPTGSSVSSLIDLRVPHYGGSFGYKNVENRCFLLWRVTDEFLDIEERSFDTDLIENAVRIHFKNDVIMRGVTVRSVDDRIYVLVPTFSVAQRIHVPTQSGGGGRFNQSSTLDMETSFGTTNRSGVLLPISVLASLDISDISSVKNCYALNIGTGSATPHTAATALSSSEEALFAYGLTDGSILLVTMAAYDEDGPTTQETLSQTSTVRRLLTGFMTPFSRSDALAPTTPTSLAFQVSADDVLLLATGYDQKVRCWSCRQKEMVSSLDITPESSSRTPAPNFVDGDKWRVKAGVEKDNPFMALFASIEGVSRFMILGFKAHGRQRSLVKLLEFDAPDADLLDFELSERALYSLWSQNNTTVLRWKELNMSSLEQLKYSLWHSESLSVEYANLEESDFNDPQLIIAAIFDSKVFCYDVVTKAIKISSKNAVPFSTTPNWNRLKKDFEEYVARLPASDATPVSRTSMTRRHFLWSVWSCCLQYDQECRKPIALLHCPTSALYGIILTKKIAVLAELTFLIPKLLAGDQGISSALQSNMVECLTKIAGLYSARPQLGRALDANVLFERDRSPWTLVEEQVQAALISEESADLQRSLSAAEPALKAALTAILRHLDRSDKILERTASDGRQSGGQAFDFQGAFRSELGTTFLSAAMDKALRERYDLAKVSLLLIAFCAHFKNKLKIPASTWRLIDDQFIPRILSLLQFYGVLRWICAMPVGSSNGTKASGGKRSSILDQLINHPIGDKIRNYWRRYWSDSRHVTDHDSEFSAIVQATIDALWPTNQFVAIFEYLIVTEQYECLLDLCEKLETHCDELKFSRIFVQGYSLLHLGQPREALGKFRVAYEGVERGDPLLVQQLSLIAGRDEDMPLTALYYLKVAEMFEKKGLSEYAIETCEKLVQAPTSVGPLLPIHGFMFKHYLRLRRYDEAFAAIKKMDADRNAQSASLRQFLFNLQEENMLGKLNEYDFGELEGEFLAIVEARARSVDLTMENYYDFLYAFFVSRSDYQKAATYSYEMAVRFRKEVPGLESLRRQASALSACLHTLTLAKDGAWIERPDLELNGDMDYPGASPKRGSDGEEKQFVPISFTRRIGKKEIEGEYIVAKGNLAVTERGGTFGAPLPSHELVKALMQYNFFDLAADVSVLHDLPLVDVIDCLALRCVQSDKPRSATGLENECWVWLKENKAICSVITDSRTQSFAWSMLQAYLQQLSKITPASPLYIAAARRFLSLSQTIPPWFMEQFKKIDFPELLRLLIEYDLLTEAQHLICDYIDATMGIGAEDFNLTETLTIGKHAPVWLPYSSIDWLLAILAERRDDAESIRLQNELEEKLKYYFNQVEAQMKLVRKK